MYAVSENNAPYTDVCTSGTSNNVIGAFDGLQCKGDKLEDWISQEGSFKKTFARGRKCLQRRITTMKRYSANSNDLRKTRKQHLFPIQVAYTYGRDCLRKFGTPGDLKTFKDSVKGLFGKVSQVQPNVKNLIGDDFDETVRTIPALKDVYDKPYYDDEQWKIIYRERDVGYDGLSPEEKVIFNSILPTVHAAPNVSNVPNIPNAMIPNNSKPKKTAAVTRRKPAAKNQNNTNDFNFSPFISNTSAPNNSMQFLTPDTEKVFYRLLKMEYKILQSKRLLAHFTFLKKELNRLLEIAQDLLEALTVLDIQFTDIPVELHNIIKSIKEAIKQTDEIIERYSAMAFYAANEIMKNIKSPRMAILYKHYGTQSLLNLLKRNIKGNSKNFRELGDNLNELGDQMETYDNYLLEKMSLILPVKKMKNMISANNFKSSKVKSMFVQRFETQSKNISHQFFLANKYIRIIFNTLMEYNTVSVKLIENKHSAITVLSQKLETATASTTTTNV